MAFDVHLHVAFACCTNDGVAELAREVLDTVPFDECDEAKWFLGDLSKRSGNNIGPKGGLSLWGLVGNYTSGERFVRSLCEFWSRLLADEVDGGPLSHEHIIVFEEPEQSEQAVAYEIYRPSEEWREGNGAVTLLPDLAYKKHKLPFCWREM